MNEALTRAARTLVQGLIDAGVRHFVVSPGSRNTPLVCAIEESDAALHSAIDERAAGFFALGQARVSGRPSVVVATSGSAGAHYFPAVVESSAAGVPLIVLTADRPQELTHCGAPQTIDQLDLFGRHARAFFELGLPDEVSVPSLRRFARQAVMTTRFPRPGAVHLNFKARKPLEPADLPPVSAPAFADHFGRLLLDDAAIEELASTLRGVERGLIACGPSRSLDPAAVAALSRATGFPIVADATSQIRYAVPDQLDAMEALLSSPRFFDANGPELVVELGSPLTSSAWHRFLAHHRPRRVVLSEGGWMDPQGDAAMMIMADSNDTCRRVAARLPGREPRWLREENEKAWQAVSEVIGSDFSEASVVRAVVDQLRPGDTLMLSNSLPVRDIDLWARSRRVDVRVLSQRGANGIDGIIAGAAGAASVTDGRVLALVGDVAFSHDLGGLALAKGQDNLTLLLIDNGGGRIFEMLPIADGVRNLQNFVTPPELEVAQAAQAFAMPYRRVDAEEALRSALFSGGILHAEVPGAQAVQMRRRLASRVEELLG